MKHVAIVGAGPAGISAAGILAKFPNMTVHLIDEGERPGGQIYRQPHDAVSTDMQRLLGKHYKDYVRFHAHSRRVIEHVDYRPRTLVWNIHDGALHTIAGGKTDEIPYDSLILATGATDRIFPVQGWTLPGVYTVGGAQILLKEQGCLIGRRTVFCGASPLLYLAALQYVRAGGTVQAVLDTSTLRDKLGATRRLLARPGTLLDGARYMAELRLRGIPIHLGVTLEAFDGEDTDQVRAVRYKKHGQTSSVSVDCDAVAFGFGIRPETQLAELAGCAMTYDDSRHLWYPEHDAQGRCHEGCYVAGDGAHQGGVDAALLSGRRAAWALLKDLGVATSDDTEAASDAHALRRCLTFQDGMSQAFVWPAHAATQVADHVALCRCENITVGEVRQALRQVGGADEANRTKSVTRCGMGRCQGRFCGTALAEIVASEQGRGGPGASPQRGRLRAQPPVKPLPLSAIAEETSS